MSSHIFISMYIGLHSRNLNRIKIPQTFMDLFIDSHNFAENKPIQAKIFLSFGQNHLTGLARVYGSIAISVSVVVCT